MTDKKFALGDYVEVKDRIAMFYEAHPDGRLVTDRAELWQDDEVPRVVVKALAYRTADDPHPGVGWSWMVLPGSTPYTKGSELENTETSAWGRAIGSLGIGIGGGIASAQEVRNKAGEASRIETEPMTRTDDGGLIGAVLRGKDPVDMGLRHDPDGTAWWGFKLAQGKTGYQALAHGPLAEALSVSGLAEGTRVIVWGEVEMVPWNKGDKAMPPFARIAVTKVQAPEWTLPGHSLAEAIRISTVPGETSATEPPAEVEPDTIPLFELDEAERAAIGGGLPG
jgi:hypothetical protein